MIPNAAYLHIPFCRRRCYYCDFPVSIVGDHAKGGHSKTIEQYVQVLHQEIDQTPSRGRSLTTIFLGGGTPSLLSAQQVESLLSHLEKQFGLATGAEISIEMDPGTFDLSQLQAYRSAGINRVSLGVQAFQPDLLAYCGRTHEVEEVYEAIDHLVRTGINNFSLDLISGLPHQTLEHWQSSLAAAIALSPAHLSIYDLIIEPKTAFSKQYQPGLSPLPTEDTAADMYRLAQRTLSQAGYCHYEISNYARPGFECRHNRVYWHNHPFYGFGMGAASYLEGTRFTRPRKTKDYYAWVAELSQIERTNQNQISATHYQPDLQETLMLGLRMAEGLSTRQLAECYGEGVLAILWPCLQFYYQQGWVEGLDDQGALLTGDWQEVVDRLARFRLSDPEGFLFSNTVLSDLFAVVLQKLSQ